MDDIDLSVVHRESSKGLEGQPNGETDPDKTLVRRTMIARFGIGCLSGLAIAGFANLLLSSPLTARLEPWAVLQFTIGALFGPAGILGSAITYFVVTANETSKLFGATMQTIGYLLVGAIAYAVFRVTPKLDRGLSDLRSYFAFLGAAAVSSLVLAVIGSASLFLPTMGKDAFWIAIGIWFTSAITSLLITAPFILILVSWRFRWWLVPMPSQMPSVDRTGIQGAVSVRGAEGPTRRDVFVSSALVLGITVVVCPLASMWPQQGWIALLYLVPILWASTSHGMRWGVLVASGSAVAYLAGSAAITAIVSNYSSHVAIVSQFASLVIFSLVGAITGAFQRARLKAEAELVQSNAELKKRHESLALVNGLADRLKRTLDVEMIAEEAVAALIQLSHPPLVALYLLDDEGRTMELLAQHGFDEAILAAGRSIPVEGSLSGLALLHCQPFASEDISNDERIEPTMSSRLSEAGFASAVSIPMVFEDKALGTINLVYRDRAAVSHEFLDTFSTIGRTVAVAIVNSRHVEKLEHLAFHDPLTGLPNRGGLHRWFSESVLSGGVDRGRVGLALMNINRFREVNDALGHHVGDRLLCQIGPRIKSALAERDLQVFRLAGDDFAVIIPDLDEAVEFEALTGDLLTALAAPFEVSGMAVGIEASAGISVAPDDAIDSSQLLRCADVAVNHAKRTSKPMVRYSPEVDLSTPQRLALASDLGRAIQDDQLVLHFQPVVTLADGRPIGFEALVRWLHPKLGMLPPDRFIPLAEVGELIHPLTYWVVENALNQLKQWQENNPDLTMAINLSTRNLLDRTCANRLADIVDRSGVDPRTVEFELTETALLIDVEVASTTLSKISEFGSRVVIDDFGTGYSSMAFLKQYQIYGLKIDRSFVGDILKDAQSRAIVRATLQLANDLDLAVVAEGIEDAETVGALTELGCSVGQGFYFMRPAAADEVEWRMDGWGMGPG